MGFGEEDNDDSTINTDVDFSYMDAKIQHALGHFVEDFNGGVSYANLGRKFGGYGSFLPMYPRCLFWSHQRPPPEDSDGSTLSSTRISETEGSESSSVASCGSSLPIWRGASSTPTSRGRTLYKPKNPCNNKRPMQIKVARKSLSTNRNAKIYRSLDLDGSRTSSLEDSCVDSS